MYTHMFPQTHSHIHHIVFFFGHFSRWFIVRLHLQLTCDGRWCEPKKHLFGIIKSMRQIFTLNIKHVLGTVLGDIYKADWGKENQWWRIWAETSHQEKKYSIIINDAQPMKYWPGWRTEHRYEASKSFRTYYLALRQNYQSGTFWI